MKRWPADAVMIVAALAGEEKREKMESVVPAKCRDCGATVHADSYTIRTADSLPERRGRPVKFFCTRCCVNYDFGTITHMHDHGGVTGKRGRIRIPVKDVPIGKDFADPLTGLLYARLATDKRAHLACEGNEVLAIDGDGDPHMFPGDYQVEMVEVRG
jgi:hypothetical protein